MKNKMILVVAMLMAVLSAAATSYTVEDVPNVQLADCNQYVSNPDGILSEQAVALINARLGALRDSTSAQAVVVALDDIRGYEANQFATELFERWGLGTKDRDSGLLLLIVKDIHRVVIRTGRGLEGLLPDVACGRIIREVMAPAFREGDYDGGTVRAVDLMAGVIEDPANAGEVMSALGDDRAPRIDDDLTAGEAISMLLSFGAIATVILLAVFMISGRQMRGRSAAERWNRLSTLNWIALLACFIGLGVPLIAWFPIYLARRRLRHRHEPCPNCGSVMHKLDEQADNAYLTAAQDTEERLKSVDYDVWLCGRCGTTDIVPYVNSTSSYSVCPRCGARACVMSREQVLVPPTTTRAGEGERVYTCLNCHNNDHRRFRIERRQDDSALLGAAILGGALGSRGGGGIGGGFGGGFGGGMTSGGGASGGW